MKLQEKEASAYEAEHQNIAERLMREVPPFKETEQLLELVQTHFSLMKKSKIAFRSRENQQKSVTWT